MLRERVYQRPSMHGAHQRQIGELRTHLREQPRGPVDAVHRRGIEFRRRGAVHHFQIEGVDVRRRSRQEDKDDILRFVLRHHSGLRRDHVVGPRRFTDQVGGCHAGAQNLEEAPPRKVRAIEKRQMRMRMVFHELVEFVFLRHGNLLLSN